MTKYYIHDLLTGMPHPEYDKEEVHYYDSYDIAKSEADYLEACCNWETSLVVRGIGRKTKEQKGRE